MHPFPECQVVLQATRTIGQLELLILHNFAVCEVKQIHLQVWETRHQEEQPIAIALGVAPEALWSNPTCRRRRCAFNSSDTYDEKSCQIVLEEEPDTNGKFVHRLSLNFSCMMSVIAICRFPKHHRKRHTALQQTNRKKNVIRPAFRAMAERVHSPASLIRERRW